MSPVWVYPVIITPKRSSNEIQLNVDMREANKAIPRTHTVMPTLDDIINELNGATVFSHLDMNHGYQQLELKENSCDITTFATHVGLYRYKRLNFGTRSAGEIFQETLSKEITRDIKGCINISDDVLVFGRNQKEHDQNLEKLRELRRKLPERIVPPGEIPYDRIRQRDAAKKRQMKEYAHKRRNAQESLIVVGDQVLLKQSKAEVLTPAFDPRPFSVIGMKGSMVTVKRGREIKSQNSSHCKLLKHAREDEYVAVDLDQEGLDTSSAEETEIGAREDLRLQPDNLAASSEMTIGVVVESDGHPDLSDCKGPKTETASLCRKKYIEDSDDDEEEFSEEFYESPSDDTS